MPPRYAYWTIIAGGLPTAFRTSERDELLPTFRQIQQKHPDAEMRYFARGRLWASAEEARLALERRRAEKAGRARRPEGTGRDRDWRPGGSHRDPRQKFADAKRARNAEQRRRRFERRQESSGGSGSPANRLDRTSGGGTNLRRDDRRRPGSSGGHGRRPHQPAGGPAPARSNRRGPARRDRRRS